MEIDLTNDELKTMICAVNSRGLAALDAATRMAQVDQKKRCGGEYTAQEISDVFTVEKRCFIIQAKLRKARRNLVANGWAGQQDSMVWSQ